MRIRDAFTESYVEAALWSTNDNSDENGGEPLECNYTPEDIAPETMAEIVRDCAAFQKENPLPEYEHPQYSDEELAGHDFWLTRNGHGAGFWVRDLGAYGDVLTEKCKAYGEYDLYVGDDGLVYGS